MGGAKTLSIIVAANIKGLETSMKKANGSIRNLASNAARLGSMLTFGVTAPIIAMGKQAANTFVEFENNMQKVLAVTGATEIEFQQLTDQAKKLGAETQFTARQFAELQLILGRKGFDPKAIQNMTKSIADLALATGSDLSMAAEVVSSSINAFNLESTEASSVANTLASAAANSSIQLNTFATAFGHAGTAANSVGVSIEELSAMMGVLMDNGIKASKAGTGLRKAFMKLNEEGVPFGETLDNLASGTMSLNDAQGLVGITAANQLLILSDNRDKIVELTHEYKTNTGRLKEMADLMGKTAFAQIEKMKSAIESMNNELGELIINKLEPVIKLITKLAKSFSDLDPAIKDTIVNISAIAAAIGPLLLVFGAVVAVVMPVFRVLGLLGRAFMALLPTIKAVIAGLGVRGLAMVAATLGVKFLPAIESVEKLNNELDKLQDKDFMLTSFAELKNLKAQGDAHQKLIDQENERIKLFKEDKNKNFLINLDAISVPESNLITGPLRNTTAQLEQMLADSQASLESYKNTVSQFGFELAIDFSRYFANILVNSKNIGDALKEVFTGLLKTLTAMVLQALILTGILSAFGVAPAGGEFAGQGMSAFKQNLLGLMSGQGLANGGRPPLNKLSLVGENGPELFNPGNQSGTIIPNHAMGGSVIPDVRISGNDLLIVFNKAQRKKNFR